MVASYVWSVIVPLGSFLGLCCGLSQPGFKARLSESRVIARNQCSLADFRPGIKGVWVSFAVLAETFLKIDHFQNLDRVIASDSLAVAHVK